MAEYIEREALFHRIKAFAANVICRGCSEMVSPKDSCNPIEWTKGYEQGVKESLNLIATHGAADVAPVVHGRWEESVEIQTDTSTLYDYTCSVCSIVTTRESLYCPNCGARMDGE